MLKTCRTCLVGIRDTTYIKLNDNDEKGKTVRTELLACIPELQLDLVKDPVICGNCVNVLHLAHSFKTRCLHTEKRIRSCLRSAELNGKPVTLTKLFRFTNVNSNPSTSEHFPSRPERSSLDGKVDNDEHKRTSDYIISTANKDSNVVTSSEGSLVEGEDESDLENIIMNNGTTMRSTLQPLEFQDKILEWSSAATCTNILSEMSQDLMNTMDDDIVKEEHELLPFKTETDEALSFKEQSSNNDEEKRSNDCKTGTWEDIKEETRSITDDAEGNNLVDGGYEFPAATSDGENFEGSNSTNLDNQLKKSSVSVRRLSTNSNYSCELYSDSTASSDANITEPSVKKRRVNYEEGTTNNYYTSSLIQNSQKISDTHEGSLTKTEHKLKIFKSKECLIEKTFKSCTINIDVPIKECFVNLQRLHLGELMNELSFNAKELFNITSAKLLQTTNKKPESAIHNGKSNFNKQQQAHSKKKSFCCNVCDFSATRKENLRSHIRIHTGEKPFKCNICEYSVKRRQTLNNHMRIHTGEKPFKCNVCEYRATVKQNLINHMRIHTGENPFKCNICEYSAKQKQNLYRHMRIHTGEKPFKCNVCEYRATVKQNLINHMRIHTGENPFKCNICEYSAKQKQNLYRHMRIHTSEKPFKCNNCEYSATLKQNLIKHMRIHTGEKPFQCNFCDYRAVHKQYLIKHMSTHTGEK